MTTDFVDRYRISEGSVSRTDKPWTLHLLPLRTSTPGMTWQMRLPQTSAPT
jgi:hypothetical protein